MIAQYAASVDRSTALAERIWQLLDQMNQAFASTYQIALDAALTRPHSASYQSLIPLLLVYSAGAITNLGAIWERRKSLRFALAAGMCAVMFAGWTWTFVAVDWERFATALRPT